LRFVREWRSSERTGRALLTKATEAGLLKSDTPKSAVRLAVPSKVLGTYFPQLFPAGQVGAGSSASG
jgi:hypothetical protein